MRRVTIIVLVLAGLLSIGTSSMAAGKDKEVDWRLRKVMYRLNKRKYVRVESIDSNVIEGRVRARTMDTLYVITDTGGVKIAVTEIEAIWLRSKKRTDVAGPGALIGSLVGVLAGMGVGEAFGMSGSRAMIGGGAGLLIGGMLGGSIGSSVPEWHCKYRSPSYRKPTVDDSSRGDGQ